MTSRLKLGLGLLGLTAMIFAVSPLYDRFFGRQRLRFGYLSGTLADSAYAELAKKPGWSSVRSQVAPGIALRGLVKRPGSQGGPWVIYYPGNDAAQLRTGQVLLEQLAAANDWGLAVFAYRSFDSSDGQAVYADLMHDAPVILENLCQSEGTSADRVHLVGFSIGGHFASEAARVAAQRKHPAKSLTLLASVDDIVMVRQTPWQKLSAGDDYQTRPLLPGVPAPVLVLQGSEDEALAGPGQGRALSAALGQRGQYQEFQGLGHVALMSHEPALAAARAFIQEHSK